MPIKNETTPVVVEEKKKGWSLDFDQEPRIIFHKEERGVNSTCYVYKREDLKEHLKSHCISNLEYLEGNEFYTYSKFQEIMYIRKGELK